MTVSRTVSTGSSSGTLRAGSSTGIGEHSQCSGRERRWVAETFWGTRPTRSVYRATNRVQAPKLRQTAPEIWWLLGWAFGSAGWWGGPRVRSGRPRPAAGTTISASCRGAGCIMKPTCESEMGISGQNLPAWSLLENATGDGGTPLLIGHRRTPDNGGHAAGLLRYGRREELYSSRSDHSACDSQSRHGDHGHECHGRGEWRYVFGAGAGGQSRPGRNLSRGSDHGYEQRPRHMGHPVRACIEGLNHRGRFRLWGDIARSQRG